MTINLDFTEVESKDFGALAEGKYFAKIKNITEKVSTTGKDMLLMEYEVISNVEGEETKGKKVFNNYILTKNCLWKLQSLLGALGMDASGLMNLEPTAIIGETVGLLLGVEEYNGREKNIIKKHIAASEMA